MVWVDWVVLAFEQSRGNVRNLNYEEEMDKLNILKKQQIDKEILAEGELVVITNV